MQKLFIDFTPEEIISLDENQSRHISKSLRMKTGDMITVCDGDGYDYGCIIENTVPNVTLKVCYKQASKSEPNVKVTLYQGLPKGDKMEDIIQKCVELGITEIQPVLTARSISRPDNKSIAKKTVRWNKIALEAAQQSGRGIVPQVKELITFSKAIEKCNDDTKIIFYEGGGEKLTNIISKDAKSFAIFIGPEGGFEQEEVEKCINTGAVKATLGARILRTQTAPVAALTAIMLLTDNM